MTINKLEAGAALGWYKCGSQLFMKAPLIWIVMLIIIALATIVPALIPIIDPIISILLGVLLAAGLYHALRSSDQGKTVSLDMLLQGLKDELKRKDLLILGTIMLAVTLVVGLVTAPFLKVSMIEIMTLPGTSLPILGAGASTTILALLVVEVVLAMALICAVLLVVFDDQSPVDAIKQSFQANTTNIVPFLLPGLVWTGLLCLIPGCSYSAGTRYDSVDPSRRVL